jgi:DNA-binding response OmpR family regulator
MRHILVVEDEPLVYEAIRGAFTSNGAYDVEHAGDGETAVSILTGRTPDLALVDARLPKLSGLAVAAQAASRGIPVILMSGHPEIILTGDSRVPVLAKPFRPRRLVERIDHLLAEAEQLRSCLREKSRSGATLIQERRDGGSMDWQLFSEQWARLCNRVLAEIAHSKV